MAQLSTTPRQQTVLRFAARKSVALSIEVIRDTTEEDGYADLTGSTITFVMAEPKHKGGVVLLTKAATALDLLKGLMRVDFQSAELDLAEEEYPFAITLTSPEGYSVLLAKGVVALEDNVDPAESVHTLVAPPVGLTIILMDKNKIVVKIDHAPDQLLNALYQAAEDAAASAAASQAAAEAAAADAAAITADLAGTYVKSVEIRNIKALSQAEYDALVPKVATTMYLVI